MDIQTLDQKDQKLISLLQDLVKIPSWVEKGNESVQNENRVVDYLENWLKQNTTMQIERQPLKDGRFNLIAKKGEPHLIFLAHTDTVQPSENAKYNQLAAEIHDEKIWGRGTTDMKSGIATMIQALSLTDDVNNVWLFLYADEEYDFLGMKGLIEKYGDLKAKLLVSSDGSDLKIGHGCRGLIELRARITGQTGHPARGTGKNAILGTFETLRKLNDYLSTFEHPTMGKTSVNVAHVLGGAKLTDSLNEEGKLQKVGQAGNVVPDVMEFVLDVRPASPDLNAAKIIDFLSNTCAEMELGFEIVEKNHDLGAWYTQKEDFNKYSEIAKKIVEPENLSFDEPGKSGYIDLQMLWNKVGRPTAFMFGGGFGDTAHTPEEHIKIADLIKTRDFFIAVLKTFTHNN